MSEEVKSKDELRREHIIKQKKIVRRRRIVAYIVIAFVTLLICVALSLLLFKVNNIVVKGKSFYGREEIIKAAEISVGDGIFTVHENYVADKIEQKLPAIESVKVEKKMSGLVTITVKAGTVKYALKYGEKYALLNSSRKVIEIADKKNLGAAAIIYTKAQVSSAIPGEKEITFTDEKKGKSETFDTINNFLDAVDKVKLNDITEINMQNFNAVTFVYQNRIKVVFGDMENYESKLALTAKALEKENEISFDQKGTLNLSVEGEAYFTPDSK